MFVLPSIFLLVALIPVVAGISCYNKNNYVYVDNMLHDCNFCTAIYVADGGIIFGCAHRDRYELKSTFFDLGNPADCQHQNSKTLSGEPTEMWVCVCFQSGCNYPFTYEEFEARGYTLQHKNRFTRSSSK